MIERAAPRWVSCRSILSAIVRSCSISTTLSLVLAERRREHVDDALAPSRGVPRSTRYSLMLPPRCRTSSTRPRTGEPKGRRSVSFWRSITRRLMSKKVSAAHVGVEDALRPRPTVSTGSGSAFRMRSLRRRRHAAVRLAAWRLKSAPQDGDHDRRLVRGHEGQRDRARRALQPGFARRVGIGGEVLARMAHADSRP